MRLYNYESIETSFVDFVESAQHNLHAVERRNALEPHKDHSGRTQHGVLGDYTEVLIARQQ
ncbi:MAG: hypothetical protein WDM89_16430 [Rhizomicrobium sp.]